MDLRAGSGVTRQWSWKGRMELVLQDYQWPKIYIFCWPYISRVNFMSRRVRYSGCHRACLLDAYLLHFITYTRHLAFIHCIRCTRFSRDSTFHLLMPITLLPSLTFSIDKAFRIVKINNFLRKKLTTIRTAKQKLGLNERQYLIK